MGSNLGKIHKLEPPRVGQNPNTDHSFYELQDLDATNNITTIQGQITTINQNITNLQNLVSGKMEKQIISKADFDAIIYNLNHDVPMQDWDEEKVLRTLFLIPQNSDAESNVYDEWIIWLDETVSPNEYKGEIIGSTETDLSGYSQVGHVHEVPIDDHLYTPNGTVESEFDGSRARTDSVRWQNTPRQGGGYTHEARIDNLNGEGSASILLFGGSEWIRMSVDGGSVSFNDENDGVREGYVIEYDVVNQTDLDGAHNHSVSGSFSGTLSGTQGTTGAGSSHSHDIGEPKTATLQTAGLSKKKFVKKKLHQTKKKISPSIAQRATGGLSGADNNASANENDHFDTNKSVFNDINVSNGTLQFITKRLVTSDTMTGIQLQSDPVAGDPAVVTNVAIEDPSTGETADVLSGVTQLPSGDNVAELIDGLTTGRDVVTGLSDATTEVVIDIPAATLSESSHTHSFTPAGSVSGSVTGTTATGGTHFHTFTPLGVVESSFNGVQGTLTHTGNGDNDEVVTLGDDGSGGGGGGGTSGDSHFKGYYPTAAALNAVVGVAGDYAIVVATNTVYYWDATAATPGWVNSSDAPTDDDRKAKAQMDYYTSLTAAATAAKTIDNASDYQLVKGGSVKIYFYNANTAASGVTLKIGTAEAKPLYYNGAAVSATNTWRDGETITVYYDGSSYQSYPTDTLGSVTAAQFNAIFN